MNLTAVVSQCANLGDNRSRFLPDLDLFKFYGKTNEQVTITLSASSDGGRADLTVFDGIRRVWFFERDTGTLPNELSVTLPATGKYYIGVGERPRHASGSAYKGDYCLSVSASAETANSLEAHKFVE